MNEGLIFSTFAFLMALKLTDAVDWSWWVITAPLWGLLFDNDVIRLRKRG